MKKLLFSIMFAVSGLLLANDANSNDLENSTPPETQNHYVFNLSCKTLNVLTDKTYTAEQLANYAASLEQSYCGKKAECISVSLEH